MKKKNEVSGRKKISYHVKIKVLLLLIYFIKYYISTTQATLFKGDAPTASRGTSETKPASRGKNAGGDNKQFPTPGCLFCFWRSAKKSTPIVKLSRRTRSLVFARPPHPLRIVAILLLLY